MLQSVHTHMYLCGRMLLRHQHLRGDTSPRPPLLLPPPSPHSLQEGLITFILNSSRVIPLPGLSASFPKRRPSLRQFANTSSLRTEAALARMERNPSLFNPLSSADSQGHGDEANLRVRKESHSSSLLAAGHPQLSSHPEAAGARLQERQYHGAAVS